MAEQFSSIITLPSPSSEQACRLLHGRGQCYPGYENLCVDWLPPYLLLTTFGECSFEIPVWGKALAEWLGGQGFRVEGVVWHQRGQQRAFNAVAVIGELPERHLVQEDGCWFEIDLACRQNIGLFLDMANGRRWLRQRSQGAKVLNLFAYTCSLSVAAIAGGAAEVVNLDMAKGALARGRRNHQLNRQPLEQVRFLAHDLFKSWGKLARLGPYDIVVVDPPTAQLGSCVVEKDYGRILRGLGRCVRQGSQVLCCLNAPHLGYDFIQQQVEANTQWRRCEAIPAVDGFRQQNPERGLKVVCYEVC